uniref:Histone deacetylase n=1 Tax=Phlebotomus papatasi TaxID=29031 RepID=A0A1B0D3C3_PHLPP
MSKLLNFSKHSVIFFTSFSLDRKKMGKGKFSCSNPVPNGFHDPSGSLTLHDFKFWPEAVRTTPETTCEAFTLSLMIFSRVKGRNVFATLFPREIVAPDKRQVDPEEEIIVVSARMDTASMFDGEGAGAMGSLVPYAVLMQTAHLLAKLLPQKPETQTNVLFILFNGESFDYIGSQRFVWDLQHGEFPYKSHQTKPLSLDNIKFLVDLGVMDTLNLLNLYHATDFPWASQFGQLMTKYSSKFDMNITTINRMQGNLPPTSGQSFLRENLNFPAVVVNSPPTNRFYHSIFDDEFNINYIYANTSKNFLTLEDLKSPSAHFTNDSIQIGIRNIASILGFSLYEMITKKEYEDTLGASAVYSDEFLYCFLISAQCPILNAIVTDNATLYPYPPPRYISVHRTSNQRSVIYTHGIFGLTVGQKLDGVARENCTIPPRIWYPGFGRHGECHLTTQNISLAISPAFKDTNYNWTSGRYSTWTESTWSAISARIFLRPSTHHEALTLALGLTIMITEVPILLFLPIFCIERGYLKPMRFQAAGTLLAGELALSQGWAINLGGGFHHCSGDKGGGFCAYADISLLIRKLMTDPYGIRRIMIVDLDAHQGNGHERDFMDDDRVFILDMYNASIYPRDKEAKVAIRRKVELRPFTQDREYLHKLRTNLDAALAEFSPEVIVYNAGTDILDGDPLGALAVSPDGVIQRDEEVFRRAISAKIPIVMLLSGGYLRSAATVIANSILNLSAKGLLPRRH